MLKPFLLRYFSPDSGTGGNTGSDPVPAGPGNNQGQTGTGTQPDNSGAASPAIPADFQPLVDRIVQTRLSEQNQRLTSKFQKDLEAKMAEVQAIKDGEVEKLVSERVQAELTKRSMDATRLALKSQYNLTEAQVARLQGDTAEDLQKDAEAIYGAFVQKKDPPALPTGGNSAGAMPPAASVLNLDNMKPEDIRKNAAELMKSLLGQ